ncbi:helix-turn-helix domain-containing protein [Cyanobium sp. Morenito 9A2]|uniref:winged helix-turn-helix transcriptional regulator n=1 Tax=Cyanobium sp. Morenito 9A2 TaxID=2823718 RepID=UPI0020CC9202|nr:helix-turn-helix domain-containing protein [Cyanobium sp. Morenito 9A2]MCP9850356.1 helix-turn-helix transcriptional regulator [Cyanobium sp. Morenito 9A2]
MGLPNEFVARNGEGECPAELALRVMQGRWKLAILRELLIGMRRFSDLSRALSGVSAKVLTQQLRELEADGVLERTIYPEVPPRVEYRLSPRGLDLVPVLRSLHAWGADGLQAGRPKPATSQR